MSWLDLVVDPQPIRSVFKESEPSLTGISLQSLCMHRDGPRVTLRVDLSSYPDNPPAKWVQRQANTVQVELMFVGVTEWSIQGIGVDSILSLDVSRIGGGIHATTGPDSVPQIIITAGALLVSSISAYLNGH
ncbi:Imm50 family immunity protein [Nocardia sp. NPDC055321]